MVVVVVVLLVKHSMAPSRVARCVAAILAAVLCIGLVSRHYHGPSSSPSLLLEKPQGSLDEKAEPGIPRTWISDKDLAASPLLYSSSSSASLPGQGILSTAMHSPGMSLASAPPSAAVAAAAQPGQGGKGEQDPSKVQDLKDEGLKQVAKHAFPCNWSR